MIVREATGDTTTKVFYQYDMTEVFVDSVQWGGATSGSKPSESLSLSAKSLQITYWPQDSTGTVGSKVVAGWDVSKNAAL